VECTRRCRLGPRARKEITITIKITSTFAIPIDIGDLASYRSSSFKNIASFFLGCIDPSNPAGEIAPQSVFFVTNPHIGHTIEFPGLVGNLLRQLEQTNAGLDAGAALSGVTWTPWCRSRIAFSMRFLL